MVVKNKDYIIDNPFIYNFMINFITYLKYILTTSFIFYMVGIFNKEPSLFLQISFIVKIIFAFFIIYRFNSWRKKEITFTDLDRKIIYSSGMYILYLSFFDITDLYKEKIREIILYFTKSEVEKSKKILHHANNNIKQIMPESYQSISTIISRILE